MYMLYRLHGWKPSDYYNMGYGEQIITNAFVRQEVEDISEEYRS